VRVLLAVVFAVPIAYVIGRVMWHLVGRQEQQ
jgi:hypothetical protein